MTRIARIVLVAETSLYKELRKQGRCVICRELTTSNKIHCNPCHEKHLIWSRKDREKKREIYRLRGLEATRKLKREVKEAYGSVCICCGETLLQFLTIDHINEDGAKHRREIGRTSLYKWLKRNNYPKDNFQLLCFNCNCGKRINGGICPHKNQTPA
jgi:hypothetical protein